MASIPDSDRATVIVTHKLHTFGYMLHSLD
jgi:hypothetical protein